MDALAAWYAGHSALANLTGINILLALSLYVPLSCNVLSLANAAFMGIGAYTAALLTLDAAWPFWAVLPATAAAAAFTALLLGLPVVRLRGVYLAMITIGFGQVISLAALALPITGGAAGLSGLPATTTWWQIAMALGVTSYVLWHAGRSRLGHAFAAIRQDELLAAGMGINVTFHKLIALTLGAGLAGLAGGLAAHLGKPIQPADFGFSRALDILAYGVVGGSGAFWGAWPSAMLLTVLQTWLGGSGAPPAQQLGAFDVHQISTGLITLLVILLFPTGISGSLITWRRRLRAGAPPDAATPSAGARPPAGASQPAT